MRTLALLSFLILFGCFSPPAARGQDAPALPGTWRGDIETPAQQVGVVFHLEEDESGTLAATLDVPAQGQRGIPVSEVRHAGDSLRLAVPSAGIVVEGEIAARGDRIDATWRQGGGAFPLVLAKGEPPERGSAGDRREPGEPDVSGRWAGRIGAPIGLRLVFEIEEGEGGALTAMAESPDQGGAPFPASAVALRGDTLRVEVGAVGASFEGRVEGDTVEGTFRQGGRAAPLTLARGTDEARPRRHAHTARARNRRRGAASGHRAGEWERAAEPELRTGRA